MPRFLLAATSSSRERRSAPLWTAAVAALLVLMLAAPAAGAGPPASVTVFSEPGDFVGGGTQRVYHSGKDTITAKGTPESLRVLVNPAAFIDSWLMDFAPPPGGVLTPGIYPRAQATPFPDPGFAGVGVSGGGGGCNKVDGSFELREYERDAQGAVTKLWLLYEHRCEGDGLPSLFGEIRIGSPEERVGPAAFSRTVRWPVVDLGGSGPAVPVRVTPGATVTGAAIEGPGAEHFSIVDEGCTGVMPAPGRTCDEWVRFAPKAAGTAEAWLRITDATGSRRILLQGHARGGVTRLVMRSDPGDWVGGGVTRTYTPADSWITLVGGSRYAEFSIEAGSSYWRGRLAPAEGGILAEGRYPDAVRYLSQSARNGFMFSGSGRACGPLRAEFTIKRITFAGDGRIETLSLDFVQRCESADAALHGTFDFRTGNTTPPPPWLGGPKSDEPRPPAGSDPLAPAPPASEPAPGSPPTKPPGVGSRPLTAAPLVRASVAARFVTRRGRTLVRRMAVTGPRKGVSVRVRCVGSSRSACPFGVKRLAAASVRGGDLTPLFRGRRLASGTVVEVQLTARSRTGRFVRFTTRSGTRAPQAWNGCLAAGASRPVSCG